MEDEALGLGAAREGVKFLRLLGGPERREDETLGVAALEKAGAMHAGQHTDLAGDRTERRGVALVGPHALLEDGMAVGLVLEILEHDVNVGVGELALAEFGGERGLGLGLEGVDVGLAHLLFLAEDGLGHLGAGDALNDGAGLGFGGDEGEDRLGLARDGDEFLDGLDDGLDCLVGEFERLNEAGLGQLVGRAFDHQHILLVADVDEVEVRLEHLLDARVRHELSVDLPDAECADRAVPRNVRDGQGGRGAVDHRDVGLVRLVGGEQDPDDLHFVQEAGGKKRPARAVAQARSEDLLFGRAAFPLEEAAGEAAGRRVFLPVVNREREEVLAGPHGRGNGGGDKHGGLADGDGDSAVGEFGEGASRELDAKFGNGDGMFLIHGSDGLPCSPALRASCATGMEKRDDCLRRAAQPLPAQGISTVLNRISLPASQTREISVCFHPSRQSGLSSLRRGALGITRPTLDSSKRKCPGSKGEGRKRRRAVRGLGRPSRKLVTCAG